MRWRRTVYKYLPKTREEKMKELFEIKPTKQMEIFNQELTKIHKAGFTGKEAFQAALAIAGRKVNSGKKTRSRVHFQLRWNFGRPDLRGQKYLNLTGEGNVQSKDKRGSYPKAVSKSKN